MAKVRIIRGAYGYKPKGAFAPKAITFADGPIEVSDEEAARLVSLGVAEAVATPAVPADEHNECSNMSDDESPSTGDCGDAPTFTAHLDPEQLSELTVDELKQMAKDMGVTIPARAKKDDIIAAIVAVDVEVDEDAVVDGEEPPTLDMEDPVV